MFRLLVLVLFWFGTGLCSVDGKDDFGMIRMFNSEREGNWDTHIITEFGDPQAYDAVSSSPQLLKSRNVSSIAYNLSQRKMYFLDLSSRAIVQADTFDIEEDTWTPILKTFQEGISSRTSNIAVDWIQRRIYWTDADFGWIAVRKEDDINPQHYKVIIRKNIQRPEAIAVDPLTGYLFWSDTGSKPRLEIADLDGSNRRILVYIGLIRPTGITTDSSNRRIYWVDSEKQTMESVNYEGNQRQVSTKQHKSRFRSITLYKDWLYTFDLHWHQTVAVNKESGALEKTDLPAGLIPRSIVMYSKDRQPTGKDYCKAKYCHHTCLRTSSGAKCICWDGYVFNKDREICRSYTTPPTRAIAVSNGTHICLADIRYFLANQNSLQNPTCLSTKHEGITHIAADMGRTEIYFYSSSNRALHILQLKDQRTVSLLTDIDPVGGIAVDWIGQKLYWTQPEGGKIYYTSLKPGNRFKVPVLSGLESPVSLALNPLDKEMFWSSNDKIEMTDLNGENRRTFFTGIEPVSLQFDIASERIFWIDDGKLHSTRSDGGDASVLSLSTNGTQLILYKNFVIWVETSTTLSSLYSAKPFEAELVEGDLVIHNTAQFSTLGRLTSLYVLDPDLQPQEKERCEVNNGDCQKYCLPDGAGRKCMCGSGQKLDDDQRTCLTESYRDNFLLATVKGFPEMYQVSLETDELTTISLPDIQSPVSPIYVPQNHEIVWAEEGRREILKTNIDTWKTVVVHQTGRSVVQQLCIDHSTGNIYHVTQMDSYRPILSSISVLTYDGAVSKTLVIEEVGEFNGIAVHPSKGLMFWTSSGSSPYIGRANMDGTERISIVKDKIVFPLGITLDFEHERLYWCDSSTNNIEHVDLLGSNRQTLYHDEDASLQHMALSGGYLYYTAANKASVTGINLRNAWEMKTVMTDPSLGIIDDIFVYDGTRINTNIPCSVRNGNCSSICLPNPGGRTCACRDNVKLLGDRITCSDVVRCPKDILHGSLSQSCFRYQNESCTFVCDEDYTSKNGGEIRCMEDGTWDLSPLELCEQLSSGLGQYISLIAVSCILLVALIIGGLFCLKWYQLKYRAGYDRGIMGPYSTNSDVSSSNRYSMDILCFSGKKKKLAKQYPMVPPRYDTRVNQDPVDDYLEPNVTGYYRGSTRSLTIRGPYGGNEQSAPVNNSPRFGGSSVSLGGESESIYANSSVKENVSRTPSLSSSAVQIYASRKTTATAGYASNASIRGCDVISHSCYGMRPLTQAEDSQANNIQSVSTENPKQNEPEHIYISLTDEEEEMIECLNNKVQLPTKAESDTSSYISDDSTFSVVTDSECDESEATVHNTEPDVMTSDTNAENNEENEKESDCPRKISDAAENDNPPAEHNNGQPADLHESTEQTETQLCNLEDSSRQNYVQPATQNSSKQNEGDDADQPSNEQTDDQTTKQPFSPERTEVQPADPQDQSGKKDDQSSNPENISEQKDDQSGDNQDSFVRHDAQPVPFQESDEQICEYTARCIDTSDPNDAQLTRLKDSSGKRLTKAANLQDLSEQNGGQTVEQQIIFDRKHQQVSEYPVSHEELSMQNRDFSQCPETTDQKNLQLASSLQTSFLESKNLPAALVETVEQNGLHSPSDSIEQSYDQHAELIELEDQENDNDEPEDKHHSEKYRKWIEDNYDHADNLLELASRYNEHSVKQKEPEVDIGVHRKVTSIGHFSTMSPTLAGKSRRVKRGIEILIPELQQNRERPLSIDLRPIDPTKRSSYSTQSPSEKLEFVSDNEFASDGSSFEIDV